MTEPKLLFTVPPNTTASGSYLIGISILPCLSTINGFVTTGTVPFGYLLPSVFIWVCPIKSSTKLFSLSQISRHLKKDTASSKRQKYDGEFNSTLLISVKDAKPKLHLQKNMVSHTHSTQLVY